jgi:hypothetical protein
MLDGEFENDDSDMKKLGISKVENAIAKKNDP